MKSVIAFGLGAMLAATASSAQVVISKGKTSNMSCSGAICTATAPQAVLNVRTLKKMLRAGDATVDSAAAGSIDLEVPLSWTHASTLTLAGGDGIVFAAPLRDLGKGGLAITVANDQVWPNLVFQGTGTITFKDLESTLTINGVTFKLVNSVKSLARAVSARADAIALADDYDAGPDGPYKRAPVQTYGGAFEGFGHTIANLQIDDQHGDNYNGLFTILGGYIVDFRLTAVNIKTAFGECVGGLVGIEEGHTHRVFISGDIVGNVTFHAGGLSGCDQNSVNSEDQASVNVTANGAGGFSGFEQGSVTNSFATGNVQGVTEAGYPDPQAGGMFADVQSGTVTGVYSTGLAQSPSFAGGFAGAVPVLGGNFSSVYWDTTTSGLDMGCGEGTCNNVTGLTTAQLQSGLPAGFDPLVWGQDASINNGMPYLLGNPPH